MEFCVVHFSNLLGIDTLEAKKYSFWNYLININLKEISIKCVNIKLAICLLKLEKFSNDNLDQLDILSEQIKKISNNDKFIHSDNLIIETNTNKPSLNSVLILDTETTGLDENNDEVIEIGCILFNVPFKSVLSQLSFLLPVETNACLLYTSPSPRD